MPWEATARQSWYVENTHIYKTRYKKILSHKLRYHTEISGSEKSCKNTRKKISYFLTCVDITNQLLTCHSPLAPLGQADE